MSDVLGHIGDGYTESGTIAGIAGLYPAIHLSWRPMLIEERATYLKTAERLSGVQLRQLAAARMERHLTEWDVKDSGGNIVPTSVASLMRLKERLFNRLFAIISNEEPPDVVTDQDADEAQAVVADLARAAEEGRGVAEVREERQRKN